MMDRVARLAQVRTHLQHLGELRPVVGSERGQGAVVMQAGGGEIPLGGRWRLAHPPAIE